MIKKKYRDIIYDSILNENISIDEKKFLLRYLTLNKDVEQEELKTNKEYNMSLLNDLSLIKDCLKITENKEYANKIIYELIEIYDAFYKINDSNEIIDLYYKVEKLKTKCNINSSNAEVVCLELKKRGN